MPGWALKAVSARLVPALERSWNNPLLRHARRQHSLPLQALRAGSLSLGLIVVVLSVIAWIARWRGVGAILFGLSLGAVMVPVMISAPLGAERIARHMLFPRQDPRRLVDLAPEEIAWGLALVTLWRLRWFIAAGLALTPTLVVSMFHANLSEYESWQQAAAAVDEPVIGAQVDMLRPDGSIPLFRLGVRALSAGLVPWAALPLAAALGVWVALALHDPTLSPLGALLIEALGLLLIGGLWNGITATPHLAGWLEVVRLALSIMGLPLVLGLTARWVNRRNAIWMGLHVEYTGQRDAESTLGAEDNGTG